MSKYLAIGNSEPTPDDLPDEVKKIINDDKRKAGFNPDGTPISNPTDTNQASEDNLRKNIELIILTWSSEISGQPREKLHPEADQFVLRLIDLIRTEKLKTKMDLLKTIRRSYPKKQTLRGNAQSKLTLADIDRLIGETKLEAEL